MNFMNIPHTLYLTIGIVLMPLASFSQIKDNEGVETKRYYITKSGQKTLIVNDVQGLSSPNAKFLTQEGYNFSDDLGDRYEYLNQAARDIDKISQELKDVNSYFEQDSTRASLSFSESGYRLDKLRKQRMSEAKASKEQSQISILKQEKLFLEDKFDGKPSYFINNQHVPSELADKLIDKEILNRLFKVDNTITGNPNGEIWFTVNSKTMARLGLNEFDDTGVRPIDFAKGNKKSITNTTNSDSPSASSDEVEELRRELERLKINQERIKSRTYSKENAVSHSEMPSQNQRRVVYEEVVGFKDSPQERARRERDLQELRSQQNQPLDEQPVRSVKRIKDRERNR